MDQLRRRRAPLRAALTRAVNEAKMEFEKDEPDREVLQSKLDKLEELMPDVIVIDNKILDAMLEASCTDEELEQESLPVEEYRDRVRDMKRKLMTADQAALFIYPMVESSLPEETLIAWQRSPLNGADGSTFNPPKNELDFIMQFLKKEVEFEDQRALVQSGFSTLHVNKKKKDCHNKLSNQEDIPTGAGLFVGQGASCVFCGKSNHRSTECYRAEKNLSWSEKSDILKKNRLCFRSMCPTLPINQKKIERRNEVCHPNQNQATVPVTSAQNANHTCRTDVLMKTLVVRVLGPKGSKVVRLIFDEGSQQSTGGQAIIKKVGSELVGEDWARNVLFGGTLTAPRKVKSFNVKVQSLDGKHTREILMREAPTICGDIARIPVGPWMKELKRRKIWLTDFENTIVDSQDVEILIGTIRNRFKKNAAVGLQEWELSEAEKFIFMEEQKVFESSVVDGLQVEQDHDGLLRVKTKILNLPDTDAFRKPVLLPKNSLVVDQLIRTEHLRNKHAGLQIMMSKLREKVWILQSRQAIKKVLSRCTV
ncbi:hypothetical protein Fcan01_14662, partial [Folsomia candida]